MYRIAIRLNALPGQSLHERFIAAAAAGFDGVEIPYTGAEALNIDDVALELDRAGLRASSIYVGHTRLVHPDFSEREKALVHLRRAMATAVDLAAGGVVFYSHYASNSVLPDLHPYKSSIELEAELLITQLRATLCDLAHALGTRLILMPADRSCSSLLTQPAHAEKVRARLDNHPNLQIALHTAHLAAEHVDLSTWAANPAVALVASADNTSALSGTAAALSSAEFAGWVVIDSEHVLSPESIRARSAVLRSVQAAS